jgi:cytochrome P450
MRRSSCKALQRASDSRNCARPIPDFSRFARKNCTEYLGFGFGEHRRAGGNLARQEIIALLTIGEARRAFRAAQPAARRQQHAARYRTMHRASAKISSILLV